MMTRGVLRSFAGAVLLLSVWLPAAGAMDWSYPVPLNANAAVDEDSDYSSSCARDDQGNWVCAWHAAVPAAPNRDFDIYVARSSDNGETWSAPAILDPYAADPPEGEDDFDPVVATDGAGHWVCLWYSYDDRGGTIGSDTDLLG